MWLDRTSLFLLCYSSRRKRICSHYDMQTNERANEREKGGEREREREECQLNDTNTLAVIFLARVYVDENFLSSHLLNDRCYVKTRRRWTSNISMIDFFRSNRWEREKEANISSVWISSSLIQSLMALQAFIENLWFPSSSLLRWANVTPNLSSLFWVKSPLVSRWSKLAGTSRLLFHTSL